MIKKNQFKQHFGTIVDLVLVESLHPRRLSLHKRHKSQVQHTGWGFVALTKNHPSKISWMKWLQ